MAMDPEKRYDRTFQMSPTLRIWTTALIALLAAMLGDDMYQIEVPLCASAALSVVKTGLTPGQS